jgi:hypothetical protein
MRNESGVPFGHNVISSLLLSSTHDRGCNIALACICTDPIYFMWELRARDDTGEVPD